jgi:hypothetical protein
LETINIFRSVIAILLIGLFGGLSSCGLFETEDDDPSLPPMTSEGAHTLGCLINNVLYVPRRADTYGLEENLLARALTISSSFLELSDESSVTIFIEVFSRTSGTYDLKKPEQARVILTRIIDQPLRTVCEYDSLSNVVDGNVVIFGLGSKNGNLFAYGTFEFTLVKDGCDSLKVTDGRYDLVDF